MKICQLCAVDFTLYHFILPLMRAEQEAGHEVVGVWNARHRTVKALAPKESFMET